MRAIIVLLLFGSAQAADLEKALEKRTFTEGKATLLYRLYKPEGYDAKKSYPLVVFLHGAGERGKDNKAQLRHGVKDFVAGQEKHPCFILVPQCPPEPRRWAEVDWSARKGSMPKEASEPARLTLAVIEALKKEFSIDGKRIYLTGLSMGGYGTWDLLARKPDYFAAGIPVCGGGDTDQAAKLTKTPIWAFHGDADRAVPVVRSREMIAAIKKAGGSAKYTEYPKVGHDSWTKTYADKEVMDWLFSQKRK